MRIPPRIAILALVSLILLSLLVSRAGLNWAAISRIASARGGWGLVFVIILTGANLGLGALKWTLVLQASAPDCKTHPSFIDATLTTTLGALLGQVMPIQIGVAIVRSLAARWSIGSTPRVNFGTTAYEQLFDGLIFLANGVTGFIGMLLNPGPAGWALLILLGASMGIFGSVKCGSLLALIAHILARIPATRRLQFLSTTYPLIRKLMKLPLSLLVKLAILSTLRFSVILIRTVVVIWAVGMTQYSIPAVVAFPLVQAVSLIQITPGNLGVTEWLWSVLLVSFNAPIDSAALFAITTRILHLTALAMLLPFALSLHFLQRRKSHRTSIISFVGLPRHADESSPPGSLGITRSDAP
jgi:Lysylphosphatidylglycerol synthase TM region